jgi:hypothetical protein
MVDHGLSRRQVLVRSAATAAGLGLSISLTTSRRKAYADVDPQPDPKADEKTLNSLLTAEYDAVATYTAGVAIIDADSATAQATRDVVKGVATHFRDQHSEHATALRALIESNGGTAAPDSKTPKLPDSFPAKTARTTDVIKLAADKEKQAAFTYTQVLKTISTQAAAKLVASIGGVEAQHFVVLYLLAEELAVPTAKTASNPRLVVPAAFILDVGGADTLNLEHSQALDDLLALEPK